MTFCTLGPIRLPKVCLATCGRFMPFPHAYREIHKIFKIRVFHQSNVGLCVDGPHNTAGHLQNTTRTPAIHFPLAASGSQSALYDHSIVEWLWGDPENLEASEEANKQEGGDRHSDESPRHICGSRSVMEEWVLDMVQKAGCDTDHAVLCLFAKDQAAHGKRLVVTAAFAAECWPVRDWWMLLINRCPAGQVDLCLSTNGPICGMTFVQALSRYLFFKRKKKTRHREIGYQTNLGKLGIKTTHTAPSHQNAA